MTPELRIMRAPLLSWESQVVQYPATGEPGIGYFAGETSLGVVDCLLWRDEKGRVRGILNRYGIDFPPYEKAGNVNIWIRPSHQRQGIGRALIEEAIRRWGPINYEQQQFTEAGAAFARQLLAEREV